MQFFFDLYAQHEAVIVYAKVLRLAVVTSLNDV